MATLAKDWRLLATRAQLKVAASMRLEVNRMYTRSRHREMETATGCLRGTQSLAIEGDDIHLDGRRIAVL